MLIHIPKYITFVKPYLLPFLFAVLCACSSSKKDQNILLPELYNLGARINYSIDGKRDTTLLFVHGWCINKSYWDAQVDFFKSDYTVVTLDLPGHGESGKNRKAWTVENFASDVTMVIDALNLNHVVLIGHSMGGNIILAAASTRPERVIGFVGVDNFKDVGVEYTAEQRVEMDQFVDMIKEDYRNTISGYAEGMLFSESTEDAIEKRVMNDILNTPPEISVEIIKSLFDVNKRERALMQLLPVKVHLINSDGIPTNELQLKKYCKNSYEVHSIGPTGHYPMLEEPDRFNEILENILINL